MQTRGATTSQPSAQCTCSIVGRCAGSPFRHHRIKWLAAAACCTGAPLWCNCTSTAASSLALMVCHTQSRARSRRSISALPAASWAKSGWPQHSSKTSKPKPHTSKLGAAAATQPVGCRLSAQDCRADCDPLDCGDAAEKRTRASSGGLYAMGVRLPIGCPNLLDAPMSQRIQSSLADRTTFRCCTSPWHKPCSWSACTRRATCCSALSTMAKSRPATLYVSRKLRPIGGMTST